MKSPEEQAKIVRDQVISKIHWGATEQEVRSWLGDKHRIFDSDADDMIKKAFEIRAKEIRGRAMIRLIFSGVGLVIVAAWFLLPLLTGVVFVGRGAIVLTVFMILLGCTSAGVFFKSLSQLATGETFGAVDK